MASRPRIQSMLHVFRVELLWPNQLCFRTPILLKVMLLWSLIDWSPCYKSTVAEGTGLPCSYLPSKISWLERISCIVLNLLVESDLRILGPTEQPCQSALRTFSTEPQPYFKYPSQLISKVLESNKPIYNRRTASCGMGVVIPWLGKVEIHMLSTQRQLRRWRELVVCLELCVTSCFTLRPWFKIGQQTLHW